jgi:hypothetical protein
MDDGEVVTRYMREVRAASALSYCPDLRGGCFQAIIHADVPLFGQLDSRLFQADSLSIGRTPNRNENVRSLNRSHTAVTVEVQDYLVSRKAFDIEKLAVQKDLNSFIQEKLQNSLREIWVLR